MRSSRNQLHRNSTTFDIFSKLEKTRQSLQKREFNLKVTFSVESPSSLLKLLIDLDGGCRSTRTVTFWHHRFCNTTRREILAGNSFNVRCHVTSMSLMRARAVGKKIPATNNFYKTEGTYGGFENSQYSKGRKMIMLACNVTCDLEWI